jgi:hypothetical protein
MLTHSVPNIHLCRSDQEEAEMEGYGRVREKGSDGGEGEE